MWWRLCLWLWLSSVTALGTWRRCGTSKRGDGVLDRIKTAREPGWLERRRTATDFSRTTLTWHTEHILDSERSEERISRPVGVYLFSFQILNEARTVYVLRRC